MTQEVFDFFEREHGKILTDSEYSYIQHIVNADLCREVVYWKNELSASNAAGAKALREAEQEIAYLNSRLNGGV